MKERQKEKDPDLRQWLWWNWHQLHLVGRWRGLWQLGSVGDGAVTVVHATSVAGQHGGVGAQLLLPLRPLQKIIHALVDFLLLVDMLG